MESQIQANAELVRQVARESLGIDVAYDEAGVRWLDAYIETQRDAAAPEVKERLPNTLGSFLGECIRLTYGGRWQQDPEFGWSVEIDEKLAVYPFNKVQKQLSTAEGESVLSLFTTIAVLKRDAATPQRPWWKFW